MTTTIVIILMALGIIVWGAKRKSRIGHWMRVIVMFLSGGLIFPHDLTEEEDIANKNASKEVKPKNG